MNDSQIVLLNYKPEGLRYRERPKKDGDTKSVDDGTDQRVQPLTQNKNKKEQFAHLKNQSPSN
jgi:hypothetical protein